MGIMPKLVGGVEIRERKPRYEGEPRYKRLDFVKHKSRPKNDEYSLIRTTYPRPQARRYGAPWEHPQWNALSYDQQRQLLAENGYQPPQPQFMNHPLHHGGHGGHGGHGDPPAPPLHGLPGHDPRLIGAAPHGRGGGMVPLDPSDDESDDDAIVRIIEPREPRRNHRHSGHTVFGSDSEDDRSSRYRSSNGSTITSFSSVGSSISSRNSRGHNRGHRGW